MDRYGLELRNRRIKRLLRRGKDAESVGKLFGLTESQVRHIAATPARRSKK